MCVCVSPEHTLASWLAHTHTCTRNREEQRLHYVSPNRLLFPPSRTHAHTHSLSGTHTHTHDYPTHAPPHPCVRSCKGRPLEGQHPACVASPSAYYHLLIMSVSTVVKNEEALHLFISLLGSGRRGDVLSVLSDFPSHSAGEDRQQAFI